MRLIYNKFELEQIISRIKEENKSIGFVPTMGAIHKGHLALASRAKTENDVCICSIFVNPTQFNNSEDLKKYPRTLKSDIELFTHIGVDFIFVPSESEMYPESKIEQINLDGLDKVMEGKFRPGHFNGVSVIVKKFFLLIKPDKAYFGEKDFQQLTIIKYLVKKLNIPVEIIPCATIREADGLAMSSRNQRLNAEERIQAPIIYKTLKEAKELTKNESIDNIKNIVKEKINSHSLLKLEYFEIVESDTLVPALKINEEKHYTACIAVFAGKIRLIDNIKIL